MSAPIVLIPVTNSLEHDSRVLRTSKLLAREGFTPVLVGLDQHRLVWGAGFSAELPVRPTLPMLRDSSEGGSNSARNFRQSVVAHRQKFLGIFLSQPTLEMLSNKSSGIRRLARNFWKSVAALRAKFWGIFLSPRLRRFFLGVKFASALRPYLTTIRPNIVHVNDLDTALIGLLCRSWFGSKIVYDSHEYWRGRNTPRSHFLLGFLEGWLENLLERVLLGRADGVVSVSPGILEKLRRLCPDQNNPVYALVRNIPEFDLDTFTPLPTNPGLVMYSGRIAPGRQLEELIKAMGRLTDNLNLGLLGYGPEAYKEKLADLALENGLLIDFRQPVGTRQVPHALSEAALVFVGVSNVCESYELSLPNKLFEGLFSGRPVAAPTLPEIQSATRFCRDVTYYAPGDEDSICEALIGGLSISRDVNSLANILTERTGQFSAEEDADKLADLYGQI